MSKKTHILILSSWYPTEEQPFLGNFVQRQAKLLATTYQVTVLTTISDNSVSKIEMEEKNSGQLREITLRHPKSKSFFKKRKEQLVIFTHGLALVEGVNIVIGNIALPKSWQFIQAKKKYNCPLLYIEHGSYFRPEIKAKRNIVEKYLLWQLKKNVDEIIAVSEFLKKDMEQSFNGKTIRVIGNHVNESLFSLSPENKKNVTEFLHISTLDMQTKNPKGIIKACSLLKKSGYKFHLTIVSDEDATSCKKYALAEGIFNEIDFIGPLQWEETVAYYHLADAFVLFSHYETFSIVLAEAWMTGTPIISTPVGIASTLSDALGIQVKNNDTTDLMNAMVRIIDCEESYIHKDIRAFAMSFSAEQILKKWSQLIEKHVD